MIVLSFYLKFWYTHISKTLIFIYIFLIYCILNIYVIFAETKLLIYGKLNY